MFTAAQEMELGQIIHNQQALELRIVDDPALTAYLYRIGARLEKNFPESGLKFHYYIVDLPEANAFAVPGGYIYVARKLIAFVKTEDELAGVMGHEMGHVVTHQTAVELSQEFRRVLGIKELKGSEDVFERYNDWLDSRAKNRSSSKTASEDEHQLAADSVGVYAIAAAGYNVAALPAFFDRFTENRGKTGGFWDFFSSDKATHRRFRDMLRDASSLPAGCIAAREPKSEADFKTWQSQVVAYDGIGHPELLPQEVRRKTLNPPMRAEINRLRISPDGRYILVVDPGSILVLNRQELKPLFRIDAENAGGAEFSLDSRQIGFYTGGHSLGSSPRVELWDIEEQSQKAVTEIHVPNGCVQSTLSRDGHYFACLTLPDAELAGTLDLRIVDVETGALTVEKRDFCDPGWLALAVLSANSSAILRTGTMTFSPDSRTFLFGRNGMAVALDAATGNKISLPDSMRDAMEVDFSFLSGSRMVGVSRAAAKGVVVKYPTGEVLAKNLNFGPVFVSGAARGDYVVLHGFKDYASLVFDLKQNKGLQSSKRVAMDIYDDTLITERSDGELGIINVQNAELLKTVQLLPGPLGSLQTAVASDDLDLVALSGQNRAGVWDLERGVRVAQVRNFSSATLAPGYLFADFPKQGESRRSLGIVNLADQSAQGLDLEEFDRHNLKGRYLIEVHPERKGEFKKRVTLSVKDLYSNLRVLWSRDFPNGPPSLYATRHGSFMVFLYLLDSNEAKAARAVSPELQKQYKALDDRVGAVYAEIVDANSGQLTGQTLIATGHGSFRITDVVATADRLIVTDNQLRAQIFGFDGVRKGRLLGRSPVLSSDGRYIALYTGRGRLSVYEVATLKPVSELEFASQPRVLAFGKTKSILLVITRDQKVFYFDLAKGGAGQAD